VAGNIVSRSPVPDTGPGAITALTPEWEELADSTRAPPFARAGWCAAWWRAFGRGRLEVITARDEGRLVGVLPVARRAGARVSTTNEHSPMLTLLAADGQAAAALAGQLFARRSRQVSISLLPAESTDLACFHSAAAERGFRGLVRTLERPLFITIDGDWAAYERRLSRNLRRDLRRSRRLLETHGRVVFEVVDGSERLDDLLDELFRVEGSGWKAKRGTAIISSPATRRFYRDLAHWAAARGVLRLAVLRVNGRAVGFHYAIEEHGVYYPLKGGYDAMFARCSPGKLILHATLSRAFALGLVRFEFLGDTAPYKDRWASEMRELVRFEAHAPTPTGLAGWTTSALGRPIARRVARFARSLVPQ
jgi:CelD/BcsL family acetyltransferase involved in cellulose biosynthesis